MWRYKAVQQRLTRLSPCSYSSNGAQINRPEDAEIAQSILENLTPWPEAWEEGRHSSEYFTEEALHEILEPFQRRVKEYAVSDCDSDRRHDFGIDGMI